MPSEAAGHRFEHFSKRRGHEFVGGESLRPAIFDGSDPSEVTLVLFGGFVLAVFRDSGFEGCFPARDAAVQPADFRFQFNGIAVERWFEKMAQPEGGRQNWPGFEIFEPFLQFVLAHLVETGNLELFLQPVQAADKGSHLGPVFGAGESGGGEFGIQGGGSSGAGFLLGDQAIGFGFIVKSGIGNEFRVDGLFGEDFHERDDPEIAEKSRVDGFRIDGFARAVGTQDNTLVHFTQGDRRSENNRRRVFGLREFGTFPTGAGTRPIEQMPERAFEGDQIERQIEQEQTVGDRPREQRIRDRRFHAVQIPSESLSPRLA